MASRFVKADRTLIEELKHGSENESTEFVYFENKEFIESIGHFGKYHHTPYSQMAAINYSFVCMLISPIRLIFTSKFLVFFVHVDEANSATKGKEQDFKYNNNS